MAAPTSFSFSPDGQFLTYLQAAEKGQPQRLHAFDLTTRDTALFDSPGVTDTEDTLSLEEKLRRERQRQLAVGITEFHWSPDAARPAVVVPQAGNLYVCDGVHGKMRLLFDKDSTGASGGAIAPQIAPDGSAVAFVQDAEVVMVPLDGGDAVQVTDGARGTGKTNGVADFLAGEEMDRYDGFWWSPDATRIAFEQVDESHIPQYRIMHLGKDEVGDSAQEDHRYPFVGAENPRVRLGVVTVATKAVQWMELGPEHEYLCRVHFAPGGQLLAELQNREQTKLFLVKFDADGKPVELLREDAGDAGKGWVNLHHLFRFVDVKGADAGSHFVWGSERSGFRHLYLYRLVDDGPAQLVRQLTGGQFVVDTIEGVDAARGFVYFTSNVGSPTYRHLCRVPLTGPATAPSALGGPTHRPAVRPTDMHNFTVDPAVATVKDWAWAGDTNPEALVEFGVERVTVVPGWHVVAMDAACNFVVDNFSTASAKPLCVLYRVPEDGKHAPGAACLHPDDAATVVKQLHPAPASAGAGDGAAAGAGAGAGSAPAAAGASSVYTPDSPSTVPEMVAFPSADGSEVLVGALFVPDPAVHGPGPYPTIVRVYGGPGVNIVREWWRLKDDPRTANLRRLGFCVFTCDNRGSFNRGTRFERHLAYDMGNVEVADQAAGVQYLVRRGVCDASRVGVNGWSYGGYMSIMTLARAPETFHVGVSGAPVTDWDGYDTHYTERYMGTPTTNPDGYKSASCMTHAANIVGKLMLVHGLIDENVHFRHTARLINSFIRHRIPYDLLLFPEERHAPRRPADKLYMEERIAAYFVEHLRPGSAK